MPKDTPFTKIERTARYGAKVVLEGKSLAEAEAFTHELAAEKTSYSSIPMTIPCHRRSGHRSGWRCSPTCRSWIRSLCRSAAAV